MFVEYITYKGVGRQVKSYENLLDLYPLRFEGCLGFGSIKQQDDAINYIEKFFLIIKLAKRNY